MAGELPCVWSFLDQLKYVERDPPPAARNACTRSASEPYCGSAFNWATSSARPDRQRLRIRLRQSKPACFSSQAAMECRIEASSSQCSRACTKLKDAGSQN